MSRHDESCTRNIGGEKNELRLLILRIELLKKIKIREERLRRRRAAAATRMTITARGTFRWSFNKINNFTARSHARRQVWQAGGEASPKESELTPGLGCCSR